jgi:hypothetical protein
MSINPDEEWLMRFSFQAPLSVSRSATTWTCGLSVNVSGRPTKWPGNHRCCQIFVVVPSPILRIKPFLNTSLPSKIACQVWLACLFRVAVRKSASWKYLPFKTLAHKDSGFSTNLQPCFPSMARLNNLRSRKPIPPAPWVLSFVPTLLVHMSVICRAAPPVVRDHRLHLSTGVFWN